MDAFITALLIIALFALLGSGVWIGLALMALLSSACHSPEATRKRGGGAGGDPGNRDAVVEIHQGAEPYHDTPCRMTDVECPRLRSTRETQPDAD